MPGIPTRRDPHPGSMYPSKIVGKRAKKVRKLRDLSQEHVAKQMNDLGHETWKRQTVGQVESDSRKLTVDELVSLASALETNVAFLMSPIGLDETADPPLVDIGGQKPLDLTELESVYGFPLAQAVSGQVPFRPSFSFPSGQAHQGEPPTISYPPGGEE